ncbi:MAG: glycosyltransferase [Thermoplasmata archaeon]|nr:glycosyltransferase [Thermoplasmata archaeon]
MEGHEVSIDGRTFKIDILRRSQIGADAVSIVLPCHNGRALTEVSIGCIRKFTTAPYELWVVDNASTDDTIAYLLDQPDVNLILNHTAPWQPRRFWQSRIPWWQQPSGGSYANAIALELATRFVKTRYMFVMHNDALPCKSGWLNYLLSKMTDRVRGVGVRQDKIRVQAMHQSGFLFDFSLYEPLGMNFLPSLPSPPGHDVGDLVTVKLRQGGYEVFICRNTFNSPELANQLVLPEWLARLHCDKAFGDEDDVFYLHLGRGTLQTAGPGNVVRQTTVEQWLKAICSYLLNQTAR